jgi:hypothetical protein
MDNSAAQCGCLMDHGALASGSPVRVFSSAACLSIGSFSGLEGQG